MVRCPECGSECIAVERITVANHVREENWPLSEETFHMCEAPGCEVVYLSPRRLFHREDVKTRVTFKESTSPRPLCYCKQVTEEDVIDSISRGASTLDEVRELTGIGGGGHCKTLNPSGRCCSRNYKPFIERALREKR